MSHNWIIEPVDLQNMQLLKESLHISELLASILIRRGIADPEEARYFLFADRNCLLPPDQIPGLTAAVKRLNEAIEKRHRIAIYGDYDVDGVCGIVILLECLQTLGAQVEYYVPDRFEEGYGLNNAAVEKLAGQGIQLLVTVDCGINSVEEVDRANELGMEVIVTDHHTPEALLPAAQVIVNPRLGAPEKCIDLCGAGVVFKLAQSLGSDLVSKRQLDEWIELAALATIADIVPLRGENRILVREGLASMKNTERPGLLAHLLILYCFWFFVPLLSLGITSDFTGQYSPYF
jgi:single-stranded-DNA-specific exonuclease